MYRPLGSDLYALKFALRHPHITYCSFRKHFLFEKFLKEDLVLSDREFLSFGELEQWSQGYDAYISGSDQIWNVSCFDWDEAYGLGFVKRGRRIAYAPSMGPAPDREVLKHTDRVSRLARDLKKYDSVSVREQKTAEIVSQIAGIAPEVTLDPTLLLHSSDWLELESGAPIVGGDYIFLYSPWRNDNMIENAVAIGKKFGMKVVVTLSHNYRAYRHDRDVVFRVASGPKEFINLLRNARLVISASFHAAVFSIIFGKQFYAYGGMEDSRVAPLLELASLERFAEMPETVIDSEKLSEIYRNVKSKIEVEIENSLSFLSKALQ